MAVPTTSMIRAKSAAFADGSEVSDVPSMTPNNSGSNSRNKRRKKNGKKPGHRNRSHTNKFMSKVNVGQTVRLTNHRIGFVRFKGKVKFGIGIWYGLELYDSITKTRHNGTVYGKRYFNCPRNKGLFVKRECIIEIIKPQALKKELKELEKKQIKRKKMERKRAKIAAKNKAAGLVQNGHNKNQSSVLALYQSKVYGNNKLLLKLENESGGSSEEKKIQKDFKRFQRLSFMAFNNAEIQKIIQEDNDREECGENKESEQNEENKILDNHKGIDIDAEAWSSSKEKPILEVLDSGKSVDDEEEYERFGVRFFYPLKQYFTEIEYVFNKGLLIKAVDHESKQGRNLILETGLQSDQNWYIQEINEENIKKFSKEAVDEILEKLLPDIGYDVVLKHE